MSINDTHVHIAELGIWISKPADGILSTYDKKMITRKRNQMIKSNPADVAKIDAAIAAAKTAAVAGRVDHAKPTEEQVDHLAMAAAAYRDWLSKQ
jgi:hypothetical protein